MQAIHEISLSENRIRHMWEFCVVHNGQNCVHNRLKLLVTKWLGLSAAVNVRVCARDKEWTSFILFVLLIL